MREQLYRRMVNDNSLRSLARRLAGERHEDLIQEIAVVICEKDDEELRKLSEWFNFWVVRTMINMTRPRGKLSKMNPTGDVVDIDVPYEEYDTSIDELLEKVEKELKKMHWYDRAMLLAYIEEGTVRKLSKATQIPLNTVAKKIKEVKNVIRCSVQL